MHARAGDAGAMNFRFEKCELHRQSSWSNPAGMLRLAEMAVEASERLDPAVYEMATLADLRAQVWAGLAQKWWAVCFPLKLTEARRT